jgi:hypothetical protein
MMGAEGEVLGLEDVQEFAGNCREDYFSSYIPELLDLGLDILFFSLQLSIVLFAAILPYLFTDGLRPILLPVLEIQLDHLQGLFGWD